MIDIKPLKKIFVVSVILAPLGAWKAVELLIWLASHITWK
jgi:hypothetical protein